MSVLDSLRARLVTSMLLVFALGLAAAIIARPFEANGGLLSRLDVDFIREPYQDVLVLALFTACATGITVLVSAWSLRHLQAASRQAEAVRPGNHDARITTDRLPKEIRPLAGAVNGALDRMSQAFEAERRFVADAAHELRTPLTVLSLRLQEARASSSPDWRQIDQDVAQMGRVVAQLLDLARTECIGLPAAEAMDVIDAGRMVREAAALILPLADAAGRIIELRLPDRLPVRGQAADLREMFRNLLENALVHGRGTISVTGKMTHEESCVETVMVTVADEGTALPASQRELMFERFRKASQSTIGSGLGLAIVREVVRAHGGVAAFESGAQTAIQICLPAASSG